jgi:monoterpene epsilon-lactone hydrolase
MMASLESRKIRATFVNDSESVQLPIESQRHDWENAAAQTPLLPNTTIKQIMVGGIACEWVRCGAVEAGKVLLFLHGGGFNSGSPRTHRDLAARLSQAAGIPVLLPDYRLAPEHPFPAGVQDVIQVYRALRERLQPQHIFIGGDSAGGGLAMSVLLMLRDHGEVMPDAVVLMSAMADMALTGDSLFTRADFDPLTTEIGLRKAIELYMGDNDLKNPIASPVYADLHDLPPMLIHVGDHELLLSDSTRLAENAQLANVETQLKIWPEMWHVFHAWAADLPEAREAVAQIGDYIKAKLMNGN